MCDKPFQPKLFLDFAQSILDDSTDLNSEACARSAASRAYYCVYHICNNIASEFPTDPSPELKGVHARLIDALQNCTSHLSSESQKTLKAISYILKQARDNRVDADYDFANKFTTDAARVCVGSANRVIQKLDDLEIS